MAIDADPDSTIHENPELNGEQEQLLHGNCHLMALAMHEQTRWPIYAWLEDREDVGTCLVHAFVSPDEGVHGADVRGLQQTDDMLDCMPSFSIDPPWLAQLTRRELLKLGQGKTPIDEAEMAVARTYALSTAPIAIDQHRAILALAPQGSTAPRRCSM